MLAALHAGCRAHDFVVVDLPRQLDDAARTAAGRCDVVLIVVPAEVRATAAAKSVLAAVRTCARDVRVAVRGPAPANVTATTIAASLGVPLAGEYKAEQRVALGLERGDPPGRHGRGSLASFCARLVSDLLGEVAPDHRRVA